MHHVIQKAQAWVVWVCLGLVVCLALAGCASHPALAFQATSSTIPFQLTRWPFDYVRVGDLPPAADVFSGGWAVRVEAGAPSPPNALCQTGIADYPALTLSNSVYSDLSLSAQVKPISGFIDRAAGLILRDQDHGNYYVLRADALQKNVILFKYAGGKRSTIKEGPAPVAVGTWQVLRVDAVGTHLRGFLNEQLVVDATDATYPAGKIGLWTKADSVTCFDNVVVSQAPP